MFMNELDYTAGHYDGYRDGHDDGYREGYNDGYQAAVNDFKCGYTYNPETNSRWDVRNDD